MKKFNEINYERVDLEKAIQFVKEASKKLEHAKNYDEFKKIFFQYEIEEKEIETMMTVAYIRNSINTKDEFYDAEMTYYHEMTPSYTLAEKELVHSILNSKFKNSLKEEFGEMFIKDLENSDKLMNDSIVKEMVEEGKLKQEYTKIIANAEIDFRGEMLNFYGLLKHMESTDREERKEAFEKWACLYESISKQLDDIYDELIGLRVSISEKLGFENYIKVAYLNKHRYDYNEIDVANFREQVRKVIVPACEKLYKKQEESLGVDKLRYFDESIIFPEGNADPIIGTKEMIEKTQKMYKELSKESGEFFDFMVENELFDLETKPGKRQGGYCTQLPALQAPFIFSNFNGTSADVDVLTHEAGHAFAGYTAMREQKLSTYSNTTSEIAEIHSMTMEHLTYPWMEEFFGENTKKYLYSHLSSALKVIPYLVSVDEFQHKVFENPKMSAQERRTVWKKIEETYLPWRDYNGNSFLEEGCFWMQKQHVFLYPFYYIDYALAQICAFELYVNSLENKEKAWEDYYALCKAGGSKGYFELLKIANLSNPFQNGSLTKIVDVIMKILE